MAVLLFLSLARPQTRHNAVSVVIGRMAAAWRAPSRARDSLAFFWGMWALPRKHRTVLVLIPTCPQSWNNLCNSVPDHQENEATSSPDQPSTPAAVPVCFFASFSSSAPEDCRPLFGSHERGQGCAAESHADRTTRGDWAFPDLSPVASQGPKNSATSCGRIIITFVVNVVNQRALLAIEPSEDV